MKTEFNRHGFSVIDAYSCTDVWWEEGRDLIFLGDFGDHTITMSVEKARAIGEYLIAFAEAIEDAEARDTRE